MYEICLTLNFKIFSCLPKKSAAIYHFLPINILNISAEKEKFRSVDKIVGTWEY